MTQDITPIIRGWLAEAPGAAREPVHVYPAVDAQVQQTPQQRGLQPRMAGSFQSIFSTTKLVVAGAIVALFGGFLLAGVLKQPGEQSAPGVGATTSASPSAAATAAASHAPGDGPRDIIVAPDGSGDFDTIGAAVESANDGDTVLVRPGSYVEGVFVEKDIAIRGDGDRAEIIVTGDADSLSCMYQSPVSCAFWLSKTDSTLANLTLRGARNPDGSDFPVPLLVESGAPTIEGVVVEGDMAVAWGSTATVRDSIVLGSLQANDRGRPLVESSVIGAVSSGNGAAPVVRGSTVGGILVFAGGSGTFEDNRVIRSEDGVGGSPWGSGIGVRDPGRDLVVRDNVVRGYDVGIDLRDRRYVITLTGNVIEGNRVGLRVDAIGDLAISKNTFCDNVFHLRARSGAAPVDVTESCGDAAMVRTRSALLPGVDLVTEEVERGVYRVLSDGAGHDLVAEPPAGVTLAPDGSVWLLRRGDYEVGTPGEAHLVDGVYRLGQPATHAAQPFEPSAADFTDLAVDVDGVAWVSIGAEPREGRWGRGSAEGTLAAYDGATWTTPVWPDGSGDVGAIEATADGAVWVARNVEDDAGPAVARIEDGEWTVLPTLCCSGREGHYRAPHASFAVADDGTAWLANGRIAFGGSGAPGPTGLLHFDGRHWEEVDLPLEGEIHAGPIALGPDGTLWVYAADLSVDVPSLNYLLRLDADGWTVFSGRSDEWGNTLDEADGVPLLSTQFYYEARMAVDPDGQLWIAVGGDGGVMDASNSLYPPPLDSAPGPIGLLAFDGTRWDQYLKGLHVNRVDIADDGTVFATALYGCTVDVVCDPYGADGLDGWGLGGLYVITPEAEAVTGSGSRQPAT